MVCVLSVTRFWELNLGYGFFLDKLLEFVYSYGQIYF